MTVTAPDPQSHLLNPIHPLRHRRRNGNRALPPLHRHLIPLAQTPVAGRLDRVLYLSPVQLPRGQLLDLEAFEAAEGRGCGCGCGCGCGGWLWVGVGGVLWEEAMEEFVPELGAVGEGEGGEEEVDVDAGAEGDVDCGGEVGGEEDDSFEVFEFAEEDLGVC